MKSDWFTRLALGIIALMMSVISLRPFFRTETVDAQVKTATRQKWEYLTISRWRDFPRNETEGGMGFVYYDAGDWAGGSATTSFHPQPTSLPKTADMGQMLKELGFEGWELVAVEPISSHATSGVQGGFSMAGATSDERWVFKRPFQ